MFKMMRCITATVILCGLAGSTIATSDELDNYGGLKDIAFESTGFFRTEHDGRRWWLVTPEGSAFLSIGVVHLNSAGDAIGGTKRRPYRENIIAKHGSIEDWAEVTYQRLRQWGVNTLGAWCSAELQDKMPYTVILHMAGGPWNEGAVPDFFAPEFEARARDQAKRITKHVNDPYLVGYYLDNELPWALDHRFTPSIFDGYVQMEKVAPGKQALVRFFKDRYEAVGDFNQVWRPAIQDWTDLGGCKRLMPRKAGKARQDREAFVLEAARRYFKTSTKAIRDVDPNHLILGCRFIWQTVPRAVVKACGEYCDVVSSNFYDTGMLGKVILWLVAGDLPRMPRAANLFRPYHELTGKPIMITEFSFRANDTEAPNTYPPSLLAQPTVPTQKERAQRHRFYVSRWVSEPYMVGWHWFQYMDEPAEGRFDGEDGNYGLVDITDTPHRDFIESFEETNKRAWQWHIEAE